ncbi:MAG: sigma-70 family RNA polymerase sigma factor [Nitrospirota bacterium]|jgi:RNA polymerase sigma-70 factor (ECF subfamily)|nr:sigma-70 family RNA polymerase sigma factor [Nitrospirota bacterium]
MDATHWHDVSDPDLLAAVAGRDAAAFERLYQLYEKRVYQYVCTLVYDPTLAEEVVGDAMMAVWRGAGSFSRSSRVSTWIFGIARHKALDALRRTGRHYHDVTLDEALELPNAQESPAESVNRKQVTSLTQLALQTLSLEHQEVLRLVFYEELPYEEIAELLSIPTNTVKTRVYYAKQRLKHHLQQLAQDERV